ncbi:MAG: TonB-dependent receptor plug domain-containing protein, partial [Xanthomonadales bacterium]|nr:TonB-dependent receptor plug domain-containing protein [Xanthomonadales bacterium]
MSRLTQAALAITLTTVTAAMPAIALGQAGESLVLEEVTVTAQKRAESLQDVPVSITALTAADIENQKIREGAEIAASVPNLFATKVAGDGFPIYSLRGVSMSDFSYNQSSPVATYVDEVYKGNPAIQGVQIFDLERIEVLRGPQGTLYGKNTTGGAINFITAKPGHETEGYFSVGFGNYSRIESQGAYQTSLASDTLAMRIAYTWIDADGWMENGQPGVDDASAIGDFGARLSFLWTPNDDVEVLLRLFTGEVDAVNYGIQPFNISADGVGAGLYGLYSLLGASSQTDYFRSDDMGWWDFDSEQDTHRQIENDAIALTVNWALNDTLTLTSISSWDDGDIFNPEDADGSPNQVVTPWYYAEADQYAQDLRITSEYDGMFNFIAGAYYAKEEVYNQTTIG